MDKNLVKLEPGPVKERYQAGTIVFQAKKGKSVNLSQMRESLAATRLGGGTNMRMDYLEITARGEVLVKDGEMSLKVAGTDQTFVLAAEPSAKGALERLRAAAAKGGKGMTITGRVQGWSGVFPQVLKALAAEEGAGKRPVLMVTAFEGEKN